VRHSAQHLFPLVALGLLAAGSLWLERATRFEPGAENGPLRHDPDVTVREFVLRQFDAAGTTSYVLTGDTLTHYPDNQTVLVARPSLEQFKGPRVMTMDSESGEFFENENRVVLTGNVRGAQRAPGEPLRTFASQTATVWPDEERMESPAPVVLTQGSKTIRAGRMTATTLFGNAEFGGGVEVELARKEPPPQ
jgi:lipopolysaccharide export system protein LptC